VYQNQVTIHWKRTFSIEL